jgi:hypothetical protein
MDGQIMKRFLMDMFESQLKKQPPKVERGKIPEAWISSTNGLRKGKQKPQTTCDYLEQFWTKRWDAGVNKELVNASEHSWARSANHALIAVVTYFLSVYPGGEQHQKELLLLPGRLNVMKSQLFSVLGRNVLSTTKFSKKSFHQRVDDLWEVILLINVSVLRQRQR